MPCDIHRHMPSFRSVAGPSAMQENLAAIESQIAESGSRVPRGLLRGLSLSLGHLL
jgi:hypothetical protein